MARKDWEKVNNKSTPTNSMIWIKPSEKGWIEIKKTPQSTVYEYTRKFQGVTQAYRTFKTKATANRFARSYMRRN